jgi:diguanylate cyclase (GGDEF)-like protein
MAERLRAGIARTPISTVSGDIHITVSIGVTGLQPDLDGQTLVQAADQALYRAKQAGKNRVEGQVPSTPKIRPDGP